MGEFNGKLSLASEGLSVGKVLGSLSRKKDRSIGSYQCGVLGIRIDDGVVHAKQTATLQAPDYNLVGNGRVDLNTGFVYVVASPKARKGFGLSVATFTGGFKINGYMAAPDLSAHKGGNLTAAIAGYALAPAVTAGTMTNPITLAMVATGLVAMGLFDRLTASNYSCENTMKRIDRYLSEEAKPDKPQLPRED